MVGNYLTNNLTHKKVPYSAQIMVTLKCNAKCPFCSIDSLPKPYTDKEMTTEQIKYLIDQLAELGVNALSLTGGEPTLRKDLPELVHHMGVYHDFMNGITSNGYLLPKVLPKLEGLDFILTSLDYPTAKLHDKMRGIKVFDNVIESIRIANKKDIRVIISTVVMKNNLHLLEDMCELAEKLNCSIELYPCEDIVWNISGESYKVDNIRDFIPDLSVWASTIKNLRLKYKNILTDPFTIEVVKRGGFGGNSKHQNLLRCHVSETYMFISHDGYLQFPCKINPLKSYNLFKYPLKKLYNCTEIKEFMKIRDDYDFCDGCHLGCSIMASIPTDRKAIYYKYVKGFIDGNLR